MNQLEKLEQLRRQAEDTAILRQSLIKQNGTQLFEMSNVIAGVIGSGGKILVAGNGGAAALGSLFVGELVGRVSTERTRQALPALALSADASVVTASAESFGYEQLYARQIEALGHRLDLLIVLSPAGNDVNLIAALKAARSANLITMAILGGSGGTLRTMADRSIVIPHTLTPRVLEEMLYILHTLVELIERDLFTSK